MYNIYGHHKISGMVLIDKKQTQEEAERFVEYLKKGEYYSLMIINKTMKEDKLIKRIDLTKECEVEFVDNLKTDCEVKAITFKPSRMKKKEELRKITQKYTSSRDYYEDDYLNL